MSRDGYLPTGVEYDDLPGFADPDDPTCECDHAASDHRGGWAECRHVIEGDPDDGILCPCQGLTPPDAY